MPVPDPDIAISATSQRSRTAAIVIAIIAAILTCFLIALGTWQVQRLSWKLELIERIQTRAHADPVDAPGSAQWDNLQIGDYEYRRVRLSGIFLNEHEAQVYAVTELGPGYWIMTPLQRPDGTLVFINRGFVPMDQRDPALRPQSKVEGQTTIVGLMRAPESSGLFLRTNDPENGRWYSRDIAALAEAGRLESVAPYFIDADASANAAGMPVGGLTRLVFTNNHLVYAITWYILAVMTAAAAVYAIRSNDGDQSRD